MLFYGKLKGNHKKSPFRNVDALKLVSPPQGSSNKLKSQLVKWRNPGCCVPGDCADGTGRAGGTDGNSGETGLQNMFPLYGTLF
jgi:hypothetical protein